MEQHHGTGLRDLRMGSQTCIPMEVPGLYPRISGIALSASIANPLTVRRACQG